MDDEEYRARWKNVDRSRRIAIRAAVARGEALSDPSDAELAIYLAARRRSSQWLLITSPAICGVLIVLTVLAEGGNAIRAAVSGALGAAMIAAFAVPAWRKWNAALSRTEQLNARVVEGRDDER